MRGDGNGEDEVDEAGMRGCVNKKSARLYYRGGVQTASQSFTTKQLVTLDTLGDGNNARAGLIWLI
jgi:hypothetical protein